MKTKQIFAATAALMLLAFIPGTPAQESGASVSTSITPAGTGKIVVEATGELPEIPALYTAVATGDATVFADRIEQNIRLVISVIQGEAETFSFAMSGSGEVIEVAGDQVTGWSVRREKGGARFLDISVPAGTKSVNPLVKLSAKELKLPSKVTLPHLSPGNAVGFSSLLSVKYAPGVAGKVLKADGFIPAKEPDKFQTTSGGTIQIQLARSGSTFGPIELEKTSLVGVLAPDKKSAAFTLTGTARVTEKDAVLNVLSGNIAVSSQPQLGNDAKLRLTKDGRYELVFDQPGEYPFTLEFVAMVKPNKEWQAMNFSVASGAVAPLDLKGLTEGAEFGGGSTVFPQKEGPGFLGFIPASGSVTLAWKASRRVGEGKLFFSTAAKIETFVGAGLLRQNHVIDYRVLQGELKSLMLDLKGEGEVLDVQVGNLSGWKVTGEGDGRVLEIALSRPVSADTQLTVRTQTPHGAFPVRTAGLRLTPQGTVRHSGFIRVSNSGSVRLEPADLSGLTQLAPDQFPGEASKAQQIFVYRFPAGEYSFEIAADRIKPEIGVSETVVYELAETDRLITAAVELDIREAPVREFDLLVPEAYSVISVTGATFGDYVVATEATDGLKNLKVIFNADVAGRQLINLNLERNEPAAAGAWGLPRLEYPNAKSVRGDIGIAAAAGFRITVGETDLLAEKALSYFPMSVANLQQAFRIREPGWSATMQIEVLEKSVQADVFHLYSLSEGTAFGSVLVNYFVTGAPVAELEFTAPEGLENMIVDGENVRTFKREGELLKVTLHQPVIGPYTLLLTFEEDVPATGGSLNAGRIAPVGVQDERGFVQIVSPILVDTAPTSVSDSLLKLDALELPAEFRLLSSAPSLGVWQYTERPFELNLGVTWFDPGSTISQVVEFSDVLTRVSPDGELVTDILYYVKSKGRRALHLMLPNGVRLWAVSVSGQSVTARKTKDTTLITLPGGIDPNLPVEVRIRIGKPSAGGNPVLGLPIVDVPVLKTEWQIVGDGKHILVPSGQKIQPSQPVLRPSGFSWVAKRGLGWLFAIALLAVGGVWFAKSRGWIRLLGLILLIGSFVVSILALLESRNFTGTPSPLRLGLPVLAAGESVGIVVRSVPLWQVDLSWFGLILIALGIGAIVWEYFKKYERQFLIRMACGFIIAIGLLMQRDGAPWFFGVVAALILILLLIPHSWTWFHDLRTGFKHWRAKRREKSEAVAAAAAENEGTDTGSATASLLIGGLLFFTIGGSGIAADVAIDGYTPIGSIEQSWVVDSESKQVKSTGKLTLEGKPGDQFLLLKAPAVLTRFSGEGLRLSKQEVPGAGLSYVISIPDDKVKDTDAPAIEDPFADLATVEPDASPGAEKFQATFEFQLDIKDINAGIPVSIGPAAVHKINASYNEAGWEFSSPNAAKIDTTPNGNASILLSPTANPQLFLKPKARDMETEETQFYVETENLYVPGPGVVDGKHRLRVRPSQGLVSSLSLEVPEGFMVSDVAGPIGAWQFDADSRKLQISVEPPQSALFECFINTQGGLDPLPTDTQLSPIRVDNAAGEVGTIALGFGSDTQPEKVESATLSDVNIGDFDAALLPNPETVLHRVFRYGEDGGQLDVRVAPVAPEVRVISEQVLSLGDERVVLRVNFTAEITRAGLFRLSFPLPDGMEIESLTGPALHHWSELAGDDGSSIILHLNGKTIGAQTFSLVLTGPAPAEEAEWQIPRFALSESERQTGALIVRPTTGIRLSTLTKKDISESDPRSVGSDSRGALAFRLLTRDWELRLGIEKLDPWITGQVLHEITLREGQTRTAIFGNFNVENASIRSLLIELPISSEAEIKTLRAVGNAVADLVRTAPDSNVWELQFKRRIVGNVPFRIEYDRRGERPDETELLTVAKFPDVRQLSYQFGVRTTGRLELETAPELPSGWQRVDWSGVPEVLREAGNRAAPVFTFRAVAPEFPLPVIARRHSLADALKLRVASGTFTTVVSQTGDQLTAVDMTMEVIQRSSIRVGLPAGGQMFSIFVNGESVHTVRQGDVWQFHILPGANDRNAKVRFVYSLAGSKLSPLRLVSPEMSVPLEKIRWHVIAPAGYEVVDAAGNLQFAGSQPLARFDRKRYFEKEQGRRQAQKEQANQLLNFANQLLQNGEQSKARWALNSVANQYALDAASNEDARVQLENLETRQAIVGLNTRRQRLYLDHSIDDAAIAGNAQLKEGAEANPVLQRGVLEFRPQDMSQILQGNSTEENAVLQQIAARLVSHQRGTEPAPQAITITLPEEGTVYTYTRPVQVAENAPLELRLDLASDHRTIWWRGLLVILLLAAIGWSIVTREKRLS